MVLIIQFKFIIFGNEKKFLWVCRVWSVIKLASFWSHLHDLLIMIHVFLRTDEKLSTRDSSDIFIMSNKFGIIVFNAWYDCSILGNMESIDLRRCSKYHVLHTVHDLLLHVAQIALQEKQNYWSPTPYQPVHSIAHYTVSVENATFSLFWPSILMCNDMIKILILKNHKHF